MRQSQGERPTVDRATAAPALSHDGAVFPSWWETLAPYFAELIGTFLLTMVFLCNYSPGSDKTWAITSNAFMVVVLMYAFGHVSGANLNPSITMALLLSGRHSITVAGMFWLMQLSGAILAGILRYQFANAEVIIGPHSGYGWFEVGVVEVLYTSMICFVYLNCAASIKNNPIAGKNGFLGLAIGFGFIAAGYAAREMTVTVMNSAIAIGLGIVDSKEIFSYSAACYFIFDFIGAFLGVGAYRLARPIEFKTSELFESDVVRQSPISAKIAAEFIGTFFVILSKAFNRLSSPANRGPEPWSVAAAMVSMVYSVRDISGGYLNPAVTLAAFLSGRGVCDARSAVLYTFVQVVASLAASSIFCMVNRKGMDMSVPETEASGDAIHHHIGGLIAVGETLFTFFLCYAVLSTGTVAPVLLKAGRQNNMAGFVYGACHTVGGFAVSNVAAQGWLGSMLNPAAVIGFTGINAIKGGVHATVMSYIGCEVLGALLAASAFFVTHADAYRDIPVTRPTVIEGAQP